MADQKRWFKVWTSLLVDLDHLPPAVIGQWVRLGCRVALVGDSGTVNFDGGEAHAARFFGVTVEDLYTLLHSMPNVSFHTPENRHGAFSVTIGKWTKYQVDSTQAERARASRSKKREEKKRKDITTRTSEIVTDHGNGTSAVEARDVRSMVSDLTRKLGPER